MIRNIILITLYLLFYLPKSYALTSTLTPKKIPFFTISPSTCLVDKNQQCIQAFHFSWQFNRKQSFCVFQKQQLEPIFCIADSDAGYKDLKLSLYQDNEFTLRTAQGSYLTKVDVQQLGRDVRKVRRRLWSVF